MFYTSKYINFSTFITAVERSSQSLSSVSRFKKRLGKVSFELHLTRGMLLLKEESSAGWPAWIAPLPF
jgi:hypothetical protein